MDIFPVIKNLTDDNLSSMSSDEIIQIACAYWHEDYVPDLDKIKKLNAKHQLIIGYLTEFFSAFNCVGKERTSLLVDIAHQIKSWLEPEVNPDNTDIIAGEWGLSNNINAFHADILYYQTRHFAG